MSEAVYYTDGACSNDTKVGAWCFFEIIVDDEANENAVLTEIQSAPKRETTNNEMELTAAYMAILNAYKKGCKKVTFYSDSSYVVNAIYMGWLRKWKSNGWVTVNGKNIANKRIWEKMYKLCYEKGIQVTAMKVSGHSNDTLNNLVDRTAVRTKEELEEKLKGA